MPTYEVEIRTSRYETWLVEADSKKGAKARAFADDYEPVVVSRSDDVASLEIVAIYEEGSADGCIPADVTGKRKVLDDQKGRKVIGQQDGEAILEEVPPA